jgi:hypothetical protein
MRLLGLFVAACALSLHPAYALLEEKFVGFDRINGSLNIAGATIFSDADDYVGIHIALKSLVNDIEQITGKRPVSRSLLKSTRPVSGSSIVVGSLDSPIIRRLPYRSPKRAAR